MGSSIRPKVFLLLLDGLARRVGGHGVAVDEPVLRGDGKIKQVDDAIVVQVPVQLEGAGVGDQESLGVKGEVVSQGDLLAVTAVKALHPDARWIAIVFGGGVTILEFYVMRAFVENDLKSHIGVRRATPVIDTIESDDQFAIG